MPKGAILSGFAAPIPHLFPNLPEFSLGIAKKHRVLSTCREDGTAFGPHYSKMRLKIKRDNVKIAAYKGRNKGKG